MPNTEAIFNDAPRRGGSRLPLGAAVVVLALAAVGGAVYLFASSRPAAGAAATGRLGSVATARVASGTLRDIISVSGALELERKEIVLSPRAGLVKEVLAEEGERVAAGRVLVRIDAADLERELEEKRLSLSKLLAQAERAELQGAYQVRLAALSTAQAERSLAEARAERDRVKALEGRGSASALELATAERKLRDAQDALDKARLQAEQDEALRAVDARSTAVDREILEAAIADLVSQVAACEVRAGREGVVYALQAEAGGTVKLYDQLAVVADPRDVRAALDAPESQAGKLRVGLPATVYSGSTGLPARVARVAPSASSSSASAGAVVRVEAGFDERPDGAVVGSSVSAEIVAGVLEGALWLPRGPWLSSGNYAVAYVVDPASGGALARRRDVKLGVVDGTKVQVLSGLAEGEEVVVSDYRDFIHLEEAPVGAEGRKDAQP